MASLQGACSTRLNLRLFPEQLTYIANHAEEQGDPRRRHLIPLLARVAAELKTSSSS